VPAVEVVRSGTPGRGPALPTDIQNSQWRPEAAGGEGEGEGRAGGGGGGRGGGENN